MLKLGLGDQAKMVPSIPVPDSVARVAALFDLIVRGRLYDLGKKTTRLVGEGQASIGLDLAPDHRNRPRYRPEPSLPWASVLGASRCGI